jgi:polysaccharide export outer membrane protein
MKSLKIIALVVALLSLLSSCSTKKSNRMLIMNDAPTSVPEVFVVNKKDSIENTYSHKIKSGDRIAVKFLNNYDLTKSTFNLDANPAIEAGYVVDINGFANMPLVGKVQISGLTREEASKKLEKLYSTILNNPLIEVSIVSIKVNIFGEVGRQGKFLIDRDNISLIDLISEAGGLTSRAKKKSIRIIRGDPSSPQIIIVDLRKVGILHYSELMIQDNDIVIVDPMRVYEISDPVTAVGTMLQPLLLVVNSIAIVATLAK